MLPPLTFVGSDRYPILYQSEPFEGRLRFPERKGKVKVVSRVEVTTCARTRDTAFAYVLAEARCGSYVSSVTAASNLLIAYRTAMLLPTLPLLTGNAVVNLGVSVHKGEGEAKDRDAVSFAQACEAVPDRLREALLLADDDDMRLQPLFYTPLVDTGVLPLDPQLYAAGLRSTAQMEQVRLHEEELLRPFEPAIGQYLDGHGHMPGCGCAGNIRDHILKAMRRGVLDPLLLFGYAVYEYEVLQAAVAGATTAAFSLIFGSMSDTPPDMRRLQFQRRNSALDAAAKAAFEGRDGSDPRSEQQFREAIQDIVRRWKTLPQTEI